MARGSWCTTPSLGGVQITPVWVGASQVTSVDRIAGWMMVTHGNHAGHACMRACMLESCVTPGVGQVTRDKPVAKPAPGVRKCNCRNKVVTRQLGPGMFQQFQQQECQVCGHPAHPLVFPAWQGPDNVQVDPMVNGARAKGTTVTESFLFGGAACCMGAHVVLPPGCFTCSS